MQAIKDLNHYQDSYIRAIRWASDRIGDEGIVCYVSNGGYIDSNTADGLRKTLAEEFSTIYCYNLRGNQRAAGELSVVREGGKVFGSGSRSTVAILLLVKNPGAAGGCRILYRDIGDYLSREEKLQIVASGTLSSVDWQTVHPNEQGDWINQRSAVFGTFDGLASKETSGRASIFSKHSPGLQTNRDAWVYNYSSNSLEASVRETIDFYNQQVTAYRDYCANVDGHDKVSANEFIDNASRRRRTAICSDPARRLNGSSTVTASRRTRQAASSTTPMTGPPSTTTPATSSTCSSGS